MLLWSFSACKKKQAFKNENGQVTVDNRVTQGENDEAIKDVNIVIMEQNVLRGKSSGTQAPYTATTSICGVKLDTTGLLKGTGPGGIIILNYTGEECYGRIRTGSIKVTLMDYPLKKWKNAGSVLRIDYTAYKVTRTSDSRSVQFDGTQYLTNESGGSWFDLWFLSQPSVVYTLKGSDLKSSFDGGVNALYSFDRKLTFTFSNDVTTCTVEGLGTADGRSNLENWGQTRDGDRFTTQVSKPYVWKTRCGAIAPLSGEVIIKVDGKDFDRKCKLGVNQSGSPVGLDGECPFGYEMEWSYKKRTNSRLFGYY
jgi:hypothetical protein